MNGPSKPSGSKHASANVAKSLIPQRRDRYIRLFADGLLADPGNGVLIVDADFRIAEMSELICRLYGIEREVWLDRPLEEWFDGTGWQPHPFDRRLLSGLSFRNRSFEWGEGDERRMFMVDGDVLPDDGTGAPTGAYVWFRDVSHLMGVEEQIRRSDRLKTIGQIAAGTAHEIRNPLTAMRGFMQLLGKSLADRAMKKEQDYVEIMLAELDRVNGLVSEFLLLSKPKEERFTRVKVEAVLQEIMPVIRNEALLHGVTVKYEALTRIPAVWVDKEQLKQVFLNLSKNAIEAMAGGGTLWIRERVAPDKPGKFAVVVRDTGPGIPADVLGRVFEPFFTTKPQGTGLGLSICQRIVHDMGGQLEASSDAGGAVFTVWLPFSVG